MRGVDEYAKKLGMTRSEAIGAVLSEKCGRVYSYETSVPDFFSRFYEILNSDDLSPGFVFSGDGRVISVRSYLGLRYRPAVKYEIKLDGDGRNGEIVIAVRSSSDEIRRGIFDFLRIWISAEDRIYSYYSRRPADYSVYEGRIKRKISLTRSGSSDAVAVYVKNFDNCMKKYISGQLGPEGVFSFCEDLFVRKDMDLI